MSVRIDSNNRLKYDKNQIPNGYLVFVLEQDTGVEPAFTAWEAVVLPIYESCIDGHYSRQGREIQLFFVAGNGVRKPSTFRVIEFNQIAVRLFVSVLKTSVKNALCDGRIPQTHQNVAILTTPTTIVQYHQKKTSIIRKTKFFLTKKRVVYIMQMLKEISVNAPKTKA